MEGSRSRADEDRAWAVRACRGDADAFRRLVQRYRGPLLAVLPAALPPGHDRDDVAQDAFVAAWRALSSWEPERGAFFTWLVAIARHRVIDLQRRPAPQTTPDPPDRAGPDTTAEGVARIDDRRVLDAALAALPAEQRTAFVLAVVHELPLADVAAAEGVPVGTAKSRISRARDRLRAALAASEVLP